MGYAGDRAKNKLAILIIIYGGAVFSNCEQISPLSGLAPRCKLLGNLFYQGGIGTQFNL
jgi:hypothetical protein